MKHRIKWRIPYIFIIVLAVLFLGVGYSQMSGTTLTVAGDASAIHQSGVYISDIEYVSNNLADVSNSKLLTFYQTMFSHKILLGNDLSSNIVYSMTITNTSEEPLAFNGLIYDPEFYSNPDIICVADLTNGTIIPAGGSVSFHITYQYDPALTSIRDNYLNSYINVELVAAPEGLSDIKLNAPVAFTASYSEEATTWSANANTNGYNVNNHTYKLAKSNYTGSTTTATTMTQDALSWVVLSKDPENNTVTIVSTTPTTQKLSLKGQVGYLNGVYLMDEICQKLYGNGEGITARNMRLEDIEKRMLRKSGISTWSEDNLKSIIQPYNTNAVEYASIKTVTSVNGSQPYFSDDIDDRIIVNITDYPVDSAIVTAPIHRNDMYISAKNSVTFKQNHYNISAEDMHNLLSDADYELLINTDTYFMATRTAGYVDDETLGGVLGFATAGSTSGLNGAAITNVGVASPTGGDAVTVSLRPVITIDLNQKEYTVAADGTISFS